ncbi:hypothetical protein FNV43_RR17958 [Rhamnella rubrinervis]|uniref:F-box/LRR-repeat protein 15-like leucin rich repeat domain-containing protein n=1 Tax=Rhamnella rubrinervis TaxID=2594499 RepID=A0A8K0E5A5_9ROSA|nr:hypothetical protein FNV43_RR17958 [Rhamnella rubrinervis]
MLNNISMEPPPPSTPAQQLEPSPSAPLILTPSSPTIHPDPVSKPGSFSIGLGSDSVSGRRRSCRLAASRISAPGQRLMKVDRCTTKSGSIDTGPLSTAEKAGRDNGKEIDARVVDGEPSSDFVGDNVRILETEQGIEKLSMDCFVTELNVNGSALGAGMRVQDKLDVKAEGLRGSGESCLSSDLENSGQKRDSSNSMGRKRRLLDIDINLPPPPECAEDNEGSGGVLYLRSGKRVARRGMDDINGDSGKGTITTIREKGKKELVEDCLTRDGVNTVELGLEQNADRAGVIAVELDSANSFHDGEAGYPIWKDKRKMSGGNVQCIVIENLEESPIVVPKKFRREEKGKEKVIEYDFFTNSNDKLALGLKSSEINESVDIMLKSAISVVDESVDIMDKSGINLVDNVAYDESRVGETSKKLTNSKSRRMERFGEIARDRAFEFARFTHQEEEENHLSAEVGAEQDIEDWPGPFATAMKIIKDRETRSMRVERYCLDKNKPTSVMWTPKRSQDEDRPKHLAPSLLELSMMVLAKNADSIASLEFVPDALRHWLSRILCDCRRMSTHFLELLLPGSPTEIRLRDCSWLTEEQFTKSLQRFDPSKLTVLQLDQCGRCLPDYVLLATLAQSSNNLPALTTLSLTGACRLSDVGLNALVSSAPALRSINLSQCSLLTFSGVDKLAKSLGSSLRELYLDDCQSIDVKLALPALKKLEQLEVLSLAGLENVCDDFITEFIRVRGHKMKKLVLTDCVKLTDSSMKVIGENCNELSAIDLVNLCKLTDSTLAYLANGCQTIQTLKLCRNSFSDGSVAAFLDICGEHLKELSLNNVRRVGYNTALSLARRSRRLLSLDLSWCRNLTDETLGLIVDNCLSLKMLKVFGCSQITHVFLDGHSNPGMEEMEHRKKKQARLLHNGVA